MQQPKKLDCGLIEGKFVNNRVLVVDLFMHLFFANMLNYENSS